MLDDDSPERRHIENVEETDDAYVITFGKAMPSAEPAEAVYGDDEGEDTREVRLVNRLEVREAGNGSVAVEGYAAVFNQETVIAGQWREQIAPGAFSAALKRDDVVFLVNHTGLPLARTRSGTLQLSQDSIGLKVFASLDASDGDVARLLPKMRRGDLDKMSFAFMPTRQDWDDSDGMPLRTIEEASLYDVSIVTTPAYDGTSIGLRALQQHRDKQARSQAPRRLRMKARL